MKFFSLALALFASAPAFAVEPIQCEIPDFVYDFNSEESAPKFRTAKLSIEIKSKEEMKGRIEIVDLVTIHEKVTHEVEKIGDVKNQEMLKTLGQFGVLDQVAFVETFTFGPVSHMGASAAIYGLLDKDGKVIDNLVFVFGAMGVASCKTKQIIPFGDIPGQD
jgi:hypothetical protein